MICPQGRSQDTEPYAVIDGVEIHRYPLHAGGGGAGLVCVASTRSALWRTTRSSRLIARGSFDVVHACNPPDLLFLLRCRCAARGAAVDLRPARPRARAVPVALRRGAGCSTARPGSLERLTFRRRRRRHRDERVATGESRIERGRKAPEDVFVVRSAPDPDRFRPVPPDPDASARTSRTCSLPRRDGPAGRRRLRAAGARRAPPDARDDWHAIFVGAGDVFDEMPRSRASSASTSASSSPAGSRTTTSSRSCRRPTSASRPIRRTRSTTSRR